VARRDPVDDRPSAGRSAGRHEHEPRRPGHQHPSEDAAQIEGVVQDAFDDGMVVVTAAGTTAATRATSRPRATRPPSLSARSKVRRSTRVVLELRSLRRSVRSRRVDHVRLEFIEYPDQHVQRKTRCPVRGRRGGALPQEPSDHHPDPRRGAIVTNATCDGAVQDAGVNTTTRLLYSRFEGRQSGPTDGDRTGDSPGQLSGRIHAA
jgi:hypothetical protein